MPPYTPPASRKVASDLSHTGSFLSSVPRDLLNHASPSSPLASVESLLPLHVVAYNGGDHGEAYAVHNLVSRFNNVYCARKNHCTVVFSLALPNGGPLASTPPLITEINLVAPPQSNYTSPVQSVAVFAAAFYSPDLIDRADSYIAQSPVAPLFSGEGDYDPAATRALFARELHAPAHNHLPQAIPVHYHLCTPKYKCTPPTFAQELDVAPRKLAYCDDEFNACGHSTSLECSPYSYTIPTALPDTLALSGELRPLALAAIPGHADGLGHRHLRLRFGQGGVHARYLVVRFSNTTTRGDSNVDVESLTVHGRNSLGLSIEMM